MFVELILYIVFITYLLGSLFYVWGMKTEQIKILKLAFVLSSAGALFNLIVLVMRTIIAGRLPLSTGYEFLLTFTWMMVMMYLIYERRNQWKEPGGFLMLIAALMILSVLIMMQGQLNAAMPLMPALKSPWLSIHVLTAAFSYACFAMAAGLGLIQLCKAGLIKYDYHIYRIVATGFTMLSLSIVLGAIWAEQAWGSYWSWDPKETWALVTWIIYALYLHLHNKRSWGGKKASLIVVAGFLMVLFTFFGVNYLLTGLHSYSVILMDGFHLG